MPARPGITDHRLRVETERTLSGVGWFIGFLRLFRCAASQTRVRWLPCGSQSFRRANPRLRKRSLATFCGFSGLGPARTNKSPRLQHDCNATWFLSAMLTASATRARQCCTRAASSRFGASAGQRFLRVYLVGARASLAWKLKIAQCSLQRVSRTSSSRLAWQSRRSGTGEQLMHIL